MPTPNNGWAHMPPQQAHPEDVYNTFIDDLDSKVVSGGGGGGSGLWAASVADQTALAAVVSGSRANGQTRQVLSPIGIWIFSSTSTREPDDFTIRPTDVSGNNPGRWLASGGNTAGAIPALVNGTPILWNINGALRRLAKLSLVANRTIDLVGTVDGSTGTLLVIMGAAAYTLTFTATGRTVISAGGGGATPTLPTAPGSRFQIGFIDNGTEIMLWVSPVFS